MKRVARLFFVAIFLVSLLTGFTECSRDEQVLGGAAVGALAGAVVTGALEGDRRSRNQCWYDYHGRYRCRDARYYRRPPPRGYRSPRYDYRYSAPPPQYRNYRDCWRGRYGKVRCR